jgi:hypothetical protein
MTLFSKTAILGRVPASAAGLALLMACAASLKASGTADATEITVWTKG